MDKKLINSQLRPMVPYQQSGSGHSR